MEELITKLSELGLAGIVIAGLMVYIWKMHESYINRVAQKDEVHKTERQEANQRYKEMSDRAIQAIENNTCIVSELKTLIKSSEPSQTSSVPSHI